MIEQLPRVAKVNTQVFNDIIDEFSNIDLVAELTTGELIYIPVNVDLWIGTSQQDSLQSVYYKTKTGQLDNVHYLGAKKQEELSNYARLLDVCIIP